MTKNNNTNLMGPINVNFVITFENYTFYESCYRNFKNIYMKALYFLKYTDFYIKIFLNWKCSLQWDGAGNLFITVFFNYHLIKFNCRICLEQKLVIFLNDAMKLRVIFKIIA